MTRVLDDVQSLSPRRAGSWPEDLPEPCGKESGTLFPEFIPPSPDSQDCRRASLLQPGCPAAGWPFAPATTPWAGALSSNRAADTLGHQCRASLEGSPGIAWSQQ